MSKKTAHGDDAHAIIKDALEEQLLFVGDTLGPRAHNIIFDRPFGTPGIVHDGVTVSKELDPDEPFKAAIEKVIKDAAKQTNDEAGDGTTTATILTHSLYVEGRRLASSGNNEQMLRRGVDKAVEEVIEDLKKLAVPAETNDQQLQVAIIASQHEKIGKEVAKAFKKLGNDAVIAIEESKHNYISSEYKDGMEIDQGYITPHFINTQFQEAIIDNPSIIVTDFSLGSIFDIKQIFDALTIFNIPDNVVIIAPEVKEQALLALIQNKMAGRKLLAVRAPSYGDEQAERLQDIAISVGGTFISKEAGRTLDAATEEDTIDSDDTPPTGIYKTDIGHAEQIVALKDSTTIVSGKGDPKKIEERVAALRKLLGKETTSEFEVERLKERIAKLSSGVAIINVGDRNEATAKELKERAIDAKGAIQAANKLGIVAGGETALLRAAWILEDRIKNDTSYSKLPEEELAGYKLVIEAMKAPFKKLMENSGMEPGQMLERMQKVREGGNSWTTWGIDAIDGQLKDLVKSGVIDPVLVPVSALQNAASAAMGLLTSGGIIADKEKDHDADVV